MKGITWGGLGPASQPKIGPAPSWMNSSNLSYWSFCSNKVGNGSSWCQKSKIQQRKSTLIRVSRWKANVLCRISKVVQVQCLIMGSIPKKGEVLYRPSKPNPSIQKRDRKQMSVDPGPSGKRHYRMHMSSRVLILMSSYFCSVVLLVQMCCWRES